MHRHALILALLFIGCGTLGGSGSSSGGGASYPSGTASAPPARPGTPPTNLPQTTIRVINLSQWPPAEEAQAITDCNVQLQVVGSYWGINCQLQEYSGPFDPNVPSVWISNNPNPPGVAADGKTYTTPSVVLNGGSAFMDYAQILSLQNSGSPEDYFSHAALLVAGGPQVGEPFEADAYGLVNGQPSQTPQNLCDWAFPGGGGVSPITLVPSADYAGYHPLP